MAADVDICNLALAYLGDVANVTSINPPDGSAQASLCSRFYPMARDELLERHPWGFATYRVQLASVTNPYNSWLYAYAPPSNVLNYLEILDPYATDEYTASIPMANTLAIGGVSGIGVYTPQPFEVEEDANGNDIILTNMENAILRYTKSISDTTQFPPLVVEAIAVLLSSKLAGPLLKGAEGRRSTMSLRQQFEELSLPKAVASDANQRRLNLTPGAPWMVAR